MQAFVAQIGLKTEFLDKLTFGALCQYLADGKPVMALIHYAAWVDAGLTEFVNFRLAHWVVAIGVDTFNVYVIDPDRDDGRIVTVPIKLFMQAWTEAKLDVPNPACSAIIPLLPIQDLGAGGPKPVEYKIDSTKIKTSIYVRALPTSDSKLVGQIYIAGNPSIWIKKISLDGTRGLLVDDSGWVWMDYLILVA